MSSAVTAAPSRALPTYRLSLRGLVHSELVKLTSIRSLRVLLGLTVLLTGGIALAVGVLSDTAAGTSTADLTRTFVSSTLMGTQLSVFVVAALAAVFGAADFANGTITLSFAAAPHRTPVLVSKLIAVGGVTGALVATTLLLTAVANAFALSPQQAPALLTSGSALLSLVGAVLATVGVAVSGVALGFLLRSSAAAVFAILGLLVVLTIALMAVPTHVVPPRVAAYGFGAAVTTLLSPADDLGRWLASCVALAGWAAALTVGAVVRLRRGDG